MRSNPDEALVSKRRGISTSRSRPAARASSARACLRARTSGCKIASSRALAAGSEKTRARMAARSGVPSARYAVGRMSRVTASRTEESESRSSRAEASESKIQAARISAKARVKVDLPEAMPPVMPIIAIEFGKLISSYHSAHRQPRWSFVFAGSKLLDGCLKRGGFFKAENLRCKRVGDFSRNRARQMKRTLIKNACFRAPEGSTADF